MEKTSPSQDADRQQPTAGSSGAGTGLRRRKAIQKWLVRLGGLVLVSAIVLLVLITDAQPTVDERPAPNGTQVSAARDAIRSLRMKARASGRAQISRLTPEHLDGLSALGSHAFRPDRLDIFVFDAKLQIHGSHRLPFDRWLNVSAEVEAGGPTFPIVRLRVGSMSFSPALSRTLIAFSLSLARWSGLALPPIDELVTGFRVDGDEVMVALAVPERSGALSRIFELQSRLDAALVADAYCRLVAEQSRDPQKDFAVQVRRAFPAGRVDDATSDANRAAFVALAMLVVDRGAGELAGVDRSAIKRCWTSPTTIELHGRADLAKHWALSAALAAVAGEQVAESMGEWKELADSSSRKSKFERSAPTGFSFIDISADRAGLRAAQAAGGLGEAILMANRLSRASSGDILPVSLLEKKEGLYAEFTVEYGGIDDPRYARAIQEIDEILQSEGVSAGLP